MKTCPQCSTGYPDSHTTCPVHGVLLNEIRDLKPGMVIRNTYRIIRKLGQGGMGAVYLAQHTLMNEPQALKFLSSELSQDEAFTARFLREVRTLRQIRHKNVVDAGNLEPAEDGTLFFSMEFVDGPDLRVFLNNASYYSAQQLDSEAMYQGTASQLAEKLEIEPALYQGTASAVPKTQQNKARALAPAGALPVPLALAIARQIAEGLGAAHSKGMVHRDIKPENILMARDDDSWLPKIADFGIVATKESSTAYTRTGGTLLTMAYAAPEQWRGTPAAELDGRTDFYALGGLLYEMLTGQTPFHAENYEGWSHQHQITPPQSPSTLRPDLANWQGLDALVLRLLEKDRNDRPKDVAELLGLLDAVRLVPSEAYRETVKESTGKRADRKHSRSKLIRVIAISALMFLTVFIVWITYQRTKKPKAIDYDALAKKYGGVLVQPPQPSSQQQIQSDKTVHFNLNDIDKPPNHETNDNHDEIHGTTSTQKVHVQVAGKTFIVPVRQPTDPQHLPADVPNPSVTKPEIPQEPNPASLKPKVPQELTRTYASLSSMLGNNIDSEEMKTWLSSLGTPEIYRYSDCYYYNFKPAGISLRFNVQNRLTTIFLYSEGADGFRQYKGDLPFGLSFQNTRREIESILGQQDNSGGGVIDIYVDYHSKGIGITYNTKHSDDLNARIHIITGYMSHTP